MAAEGTALIDVGVLFAAVALAGLVANQLKQSVIPFYIVIGMLLGEHLLGAVSPWYLVETDFIHLGAELGIVFLLFFLGLEFNLDRLLAAKDRIGRAGTYDLIINFGVGMVLGYALFGEFLPAFLVAGIVYISSSAIITKSLIDLGWIANDEADPMLGTLVYEDLFIAIYLVVASALILGGGDMGEAAGDIGIAVVFIILLLLFVHFGTAFLQQSLETDSHEYFVLRAIGITVLIAGAALALGVSEAVAAFFVGMAFSSTDHVHELERLLEPVRDTFAAVFFFWIGLVTNPFLFAGVAAMVAAAVVLTTPTKLISGYLGGRVYDLDERRSVRVGLGMVTRGEFSLIIASIAIAGADTGLAAETAGQINAFAVGYVLFMSILGTTLMQYSGRIESAVVPRLESSRVEAQPSDD
ncbi:cation:proton antiporter [Natrononativus amylolyticus]|uniref:cation:proton antiporter n=1 Tax=Natrononativus amylolyticus TaxID=2963434 RepID=UPI0020CF6578|nr:cation:proton antiporter [Natrononativus amylolyticus]